MVSKTVRKRQLKIFVQVQGEILQESSGNSDPGHFENGKQVGEWITWDKQGRKYKVTQIKPKPGKA